MRIPSEMAGERVIVVSDDADILDLLRKVLTAEGYEVDVASSHEEALELTWSNLYGAAILDFSPLGMQLNSEIRQIDERLAGRIIFLSRTLQPNSTLSYEASHGGGSLPNRYCVQEVPAAVKNLLVS